MIGKVLPELLVLGVVADLIDTVLHEFPILTDPLRLVIDDFREDILGEEEEVESGEGDGVHGVVVVRHVHCQLFRSEHDHVDAHHDAYVAYELEQVHPEADVLLRGRHVLLLVFTHACQLNRHANETCKDRE